jgi:hypothetical protein
MLQAMTGNPERFPILTGGGVNRERPSIPWAAIAPHERRAVLNHGQSLRTLAGRGGLSWSEALATLTDKPLDWSRKPDQAAARLRVLALVGEGPADGK